MELLKQLKRTAQEKLQERNYEKREVTVNRVGVFTDLEGKQQFIIVAEIGSKICVGRGDSINLAVENCNLHLDVQIGKEYEYYPLNGNVALDFFKAKKQQIADFCATKTSDVECKLNVHENDCAVYFEMNFPEIYESETMLSVELHYDCYKKKMEIKRDFHPEITLESFSDYLTPHDYSLIEKILL